MAEQARAAGAAPADRLAPHRIRHVYRMTQAVLGPLTTVNEGYVTHVTSG